MPERNSGLLVSNATAPSSGNQYTRILQWFGGPLRVSAAGMFDGATFKLLYCTKFPTGGDRADYSNGAKFTDADWTELTTISAAGSFTLPNLNPCALIVRAATPGTNTRVRITAN